MAKGIAREIKASNGSVELLLTEEITQNTAERLIAQLSAYKGQHIDLSIYSQGGNAEAAFAIYDYITAKDNNMHITAKVYGMAASGAMIIAAGCEKRMIGDSSFAMAHYAYTADPSVKLSESEQARLDAMNERQIALFQQITGKGRVEIKHMLDEGCDMAAGDAVSFGLFNGTIEQAKLAALITQKKMAEDKKVRAFKVSTTDAAKAVLSGQIEIPESEIASTDAAKITALDAQIATLTKERDDFKTKAEAEAAKVAAETAKVTAEAAKATKAEEDKVKVDAELVAAKGDNVKYLAAIEGLKKNPLVAQVLPNGQSVVIPGKLIGDVVPDGMTREGLQIKQTTDAYEAFKKKKYAQAKTA